MNPKTTVECRREAPQQAGNCGFRVEPGVRITRSAHRGFGDQEFYELLVLYGGISAPTWPRRGRGLGQAGRATPR
ncbi:MAG TPA: hypothetical protein VH877_33965, partial [Polyangia bacterium]|nr:hypothetical protein [Polyangia bacterium]